MVNRLFSGYVFAVLLLSLVGDAVASPTPVEKPQFGLKYTKGALAAAPSTAMNLWGQAMLPTCDAWITPKIWWVHFSVEDAEGIPIEELGDYILVSTDTVPVTWGAGGVFDWSHSLYVKDSNGTFLPWPSGTYYVVAELYTDQDILHGSTTMEVIIP